MLALDKYGYSTLSVVLFAIDIQESSEVYSISVCQHTPLYSFSMTFVRYALLYQWLYREFLLW